MGSKQQCSAHLDGGRACPLRPCPFIPTALKHARHGLLEGIDFMCSRSSFLCCSCVSRLSGSTRYQDISANLFLAPGVCCRHDQGMRCIQIHVPLSPCHVLVFARLCVCSCGVCMFLSSSSSHGEAGDGMVTLSQVLIRRGSHDQRCAPNRARPADHSESNKSTSLPSD